MHPPSPVSCRPRIRTDSTRFRTWAPRAKSAELVLGEGEEPSRLAMATSDHGYFEIETGPFPPGTRYGYSLDGGPVRPDPVTLSQPDGVHRMSALVDPSTFSWSAENPSIARQDLVIYEIHVGTFTGEGTFASAIDRLDDLVELGITAIEILPVAQFPGRRNWGYDGVHPYAAQDSYGGPEGLCRLVDAAHQRGLAVILDVVFNHLGPEGNYLGEFGPYFTPRHPTPWGPGFDFDGPESRPVRDWVLDCVRYWIGDLRIDGLRLDAVHAIQDESDTHLLTEIKRVADVAAGERGGEATIIAESLLNDVTMVTAVDDGGYGLDGEWNEDLHHAVTAWLTGERHGKYTDYGGAEAIESVFRDTFHLAGRHSEFYGRDWGASAGDLPGDRFVVSLQNHDHVGNRARGERLAELIDEDRLRLGACLSLLSPFLPLLFMGEEYGESRPFPFFCEFSDPAVIAGVRRGRRRDYDLEGPIPDPQDESTFTSARLSWSWEEDPMRQRLREFYRDLIRLRREIPELRDFRSRSVRLVDPDSDPLLEVLRGETGSLLCLFHLGEGERPLPASSVIWRSGAGDSDRIAPFETVLVTSDQDPIPTPARPPAPGASGRR